MSAISKLVRLALVAVPALAGAAFSSAAEAGTITLAYSPGQYSSSGGGEFKVTQFSGAVVPPVGAHVNDPGGIFETFCLEHGEVFSPGTQYNWTMSTAAHAGGGDAAHGAQQDGSGNWFDPIDSRTAYLYTQFWNGTLQWTDSANVLKSYDYVGIGAGRPVSADALQKAIWYLENELSLTDIGGTSSDAYRLTLAAQHAIDIGQWSGIGNVRVLTLTDNAGNFRQDQLFVTSVPLPPAAVMGLGLMAAMAALGARRRRARLAFERS